MIILSSSGIPKDANFAQMSPVYDVPIETMREFLVKHLNG